jgi:NADPH2:quinone reductase
MRVVRVREFGPPEVMRIEETEPPRPSDGQLLVEVEMAGATFAETIVRSGRFPLPLPYEPGLEVGGRVVEAGPGTDRSLLGQRVVGTTLGNTGGYAELAIVESHHLFRVPDGLPLERAVPVFQAGAVALGVLAAMRVADGETVLITAAAGRIGTLLVQLATSAGARVIAAARGAEKLAVAAAAGADVVVDYGQSDWVARTMSATDGRGADVVLDAIGGHLGEQALQCVSAGGRFGVYGFASGTWLPVDVRLVAERGLSVVGPLGITFAKPIPEQRADADRALNAAADGTLRPRVHAIYPLARVIEAHAEIEQRRTVGAVLLTP